ncbi:MAG: glycoside hydrolase family 31 protein [Paludibacter sp.]|nr:glycoside hydrolase family 31 protein [Paludibacter sp.]
MKIKIDITILFIFLFSSLFAQTSFLTNEGVAVFCPANMDSTGTLPSLALVKNLQPQGSVPDNWKTRPVFSKINGKSSVTITYDEDADLYGNGEVTGSLRRNNTSITLWNTDNYLYTSVDNGKRLYQSHPWVMGVRKDGTAFGIIADNSWKQYFDLSNPLTITSEGPAFRVIIIEKQNPMEVQKTLAELTGKINLPPLWAIGYQQSKYTYSPDTRVKEIADEFRNRKIPADVIWLDIDYMSNYKVFTFNPTTFSNPKGLNDYLHTKNFKAVYMIDPGVKKETGYTVYDSGVARGHFVRTSTGQEFNGTVWPGNCVFPDFTRPATQCWWADLYSNFMSLGIDGVWNDMNEPSVFNGSNGTMPEDNIHRGGGDLPAGSHARYHNVYGMLMVKSSRDGLISANPDKRPFILSRSNFLGGQRYAATWTGDNRSTWDYLKMSIPMCINLSLSGQPFNGPDIGGFDGDCNAELLGHWMALGAYYPFSRNHSSNNTIDQEPWAFGKSIEDVSRTALNRRYRLMPYLYSLFREASVSGNPIMQPAFFADYTDANLRSEQQLFLLGSDLLIAPRWATNVSFPKGNWNQVKFENIDDGYQPYVFLRPGAIVPITGIIQSTAEYKTDSVTLLMNPNTDGSAQGKLYDDAGNGYDYQTGDYAVHQFVSSKFHEDSLKIIINQTEGNRKVNRTYRIGYVLNNTIAYSNWSKDSVRYVKIIADTQPTIDKALIPSMYISGVFNKSTTLTLPMKYLGNNKWVTDTIPLSVGKQSFKFWTQKDSSDDVWGNAVGISGTAEKGLPTAPDITYTIPEVGKYIISFNQLTKNYAIMKATI